MKIWVIGEPLEAYSNKEKALAVLSRCLENEAKELQGMERRILLFLLEHFQVELALEFYSRFDRDKIRLRIEELEVKS